MTSRGIDIKNIGFVLNFDFPITPETYIHWIGRTGWYESESFSISFVYEKELKALREMDLFFDMNIKELRDYENLAESSKN